MDWSNDSYILISREIHIWGPPWLININEMNILRENFKVENVSYTNLIRKEPNW